MSVKTVKTIALRLTFDHHDAEEFNEDLQSIFVTHRRDPDEQIESVRATVDCDEDGFTVTLYIEERKER
jgi:hypothetical protein